MRDLEIRGAGNLLGQEQSGHINAVGYETYRRLLSQAVIRLKREQQTEQLQRSRLEGQPLEPVSDIALGVSAAVSPDYVPDEEARMAVLREFDRVRSPEQIESVLAGVQDRFGPPPKPVKQLARLFFLKHALGALGMAGVQWVDKHLLLKPRDMKLFEKSMRPLDIDLRIITPRRAHWVLPPGLDQPDLVLDYLFNAVIACRKPRIKRKSPARRSR